MYLQGISNYDNRMRANNPTFKSKLTFDIGASDPRGTLKLLVQDNDGKDLFEYKGFVNDSTKGFKSNIDFIRKLAQVVDIESKVERDIISLEKRIRTNGLSEEEAKKAKDKLGELSSMLKILQERNPAEKKLTGIALLLPGTLKGKTALFTANLRRTDGQSLTNIKLKKLITEIRKQGKVELKDRFNTKTNFVACKDIAGTGIGVAEKIAHRYRKRFKDGFFASIVQTGGGFGAASVKVKQEYVAIETSECSHDLYFDPQTGGEKRLGKLGTSTSSVIENFANEIGITASDDIKALVATGNAKIATSKQIKFDNIKDAKAIDILLKTQAYCVHSRNNSMTTLAIKDSHVNMFNAGSKRAVQAYADALARHAISMINHGANLYVLSGPLAMGLNDRVKEAPEVFDGAIGLRGLILKAIDDRVGKDDTCNGLRKANRFDVVCDRKLSSENNTRGGSLLLSKRAHSLEMSRGEWIGIPLKALKSLPHSAKKNIKNGAKQALEKGLKK